MPINSYPTRRPREHKVVQTSMLMNGMSMAMEVDGSVTTQNYVSAPPAGETWYVYRLGLWIEDSGTMDSTDFGAITGGLTNGLNVIQILHSVEYTFHNFKNNKMIAMHFTDSNHMVGESNGFLNSNKIFLGHHEFKNEIILDGDHGDSITARITDDLTSLVHMMCSITYWREIIPV